LPEIIEAKVEKLDGEKMSDGYLEMYREKKMVKYVEINTKADMLIVILSWEFDLNFSSTRKFFVDEGIREWIVKELTQLGVAV
jgi:hypothetical protein